MNIQSHSESQSFASSEYWPSEDSSGLLSRRDLPNRTRGQRQKRSRERASSRNCRGKDYFWSPQENARYRQFLEENRVIFGKSLKERKSLKIHFLMSQHIKTRNPKQCRSHHQKMTKAHGSLESIVVYIEWLAKEQKEKMQNRLLNPGDSSHEGQAASGSLLQQGSQKHRKEGHSIWNCLINNP